MQNYYIHSRNKISSAFIWDGKKQMKILKLQFTVQKLYINI